jgi:hypothetical protein
MAFTIFLSVWIYYTPLFKDANNMYPMSYFVMYALLNSVYAFVFSAMALVKTAFFTQISDPQIGGTYMTLLNTVANIGVHWPTTLILYLIDVFSYKGCVYTEKGVLSSTNYNHKMKFFTLLKSLDENTCSNEYDLKVSSFHFFVLILVNISQNVIFFCK